MTDILGRKLFVADMGDCLGAFDDFDSIQYVWSAVSNGEYVKLSSRLNGSVFFDIQGLTKAEIFKEIARYVLSGDLRESVPTCMVTDYAERLRIDSLFRR